MAGRFTIKNYILETNLYFRRVGAAIAIMIVLLVGLVARLVYLQVYQHNNYQTLSNKNRIAFIPIPPTRGLIYDRQGRLLAENQAVFSLEISPEQVEDLEYTLRELAKILEISPDDIRRFHQLRKRQANFASVPLLRNLSEAQIARFSVQQYRFPGVQVEARLIRHYPYGALFAHGIGYVGKINEAELAELDPVQYKATRDIGKIGIEKYYESQLHGQVGYEEVEIDARGRVVRVLKRTAPVAGQDLVLNLDVDLQQMAAQALGNQRGAIVAIAPDTGAVLAFVSQPSFDPNDFVQGIDIESYAELRDSKERPLFNRALRGQYSPGSTIKPMLGFMALEQSVVSSDETIVDPGWYQLDSDDRKFRDHKRSGHGTVDLRTAIIVSCDTYYYNLAYKMGIDRISNSMRAFGFGQLTGIDLSDELAGVMPSRVWKSEHLKTPWYPGETLNVGIGQGFWTATPLQLAQSLAILLNQGKQFAPRVAHSIGHYPHMTSLSSPSTQVYEMRSKGNLDLVLSSMQEVVSSERGTAHKAFIGASYASAGKTGTAQVISMKAQEEYNAKKLANEFHDNALYIGFVPVNNPKLVLAVLVENAGHGGSSAAPIARQIFDDYMMRENTYVAPQSR